MEMHEFTIIASGLDPEAEDFEDRFFEAGCDDATISWRKGVIVLMFVRQAPTLIEAMVSAAASVEEAGAKVERFEPDHLVNITDIAERASMTRAAISLYTRGERASGFPHPVARITSESPLWDWAEVAEWLFEHRKVSFDVVVEARLLRRVNRAVDSGAGRALDELRAIEA